MAIKAIKRITLGCAIFALIFISCNGCKSLCTGYSTYALVGGSYIFSPSTDSIKVGDTLWVSAMIPTTLKYVNGASVDSSVYDLSGATNVITDIHLGVLKEQNVEPGGIDSFQLLTPSAGKIIPNPQIPGFAQTIYFVQQNGMFTFSMGLVAQKRGIYACAIIDIFQAVKNCDHASVSLILNNTDKHQNYLQEIFYGGGTVGQADQTHTYCFKVY